MLNLIIPVRWPVTPLHWHIFINFWLFLPTVYFLKAFLMLGTRCSSSYVMTLSSQSSLSIASRKSLISKKPKWLLFVPLSLGLTRTFKFYKSHGGYGQQVCLSVYPSFLPSIHPVIHPSIYLSPTYVSFFSHPFKARSRPLMFVTNSAMLLI